MSELVDDCITVVIVRVSAPRMMRFRASSVVAIALLGVYLVTIAMVGCNISWLVGVDSPSNRMERSVDTNCGCRCGEEGSRKCPSDLSKRELSTTQDTADEISRLVDLIIKEGVERDKILEEADSKLLNRRPRLMNCSGIEESSDEQSEAIHTEPSVVKVDGSKDLVRIMGAFQGEWRKNETLFQQMKRDLTRCCEARASFMTKQNVRLGQVLPNVLNPKLPLKITREIYKTLIKDSPFKDKRFSKCAVVGNSGILRGSGCGPSIDSADAVFRCNLPPIGEKIYWEDAGVKSSFTTAPMSLLKSYSQMQEMSVREKFLTDMEPYSGILSAKKPNNYTRFMIEMIASERKGRLQMVYEHPHHFLRTNNYWNNHGIPKKITSGIYLISLAMTRCDEVHVYGFWPFHYDDKGNAVAYHYYKAPVFAKDAHDMPLEFMRVRRLHQDGVLKVHMRCSRDLTHDQSHDMSRDQVKPTDDLIGDLGDAKETEQNVPQGANILHGDKFRFQNSKFDAAWKKLDEIFP